MAFVSIFVTKSNKILIFKKNKNKKTNGLERHLQAILWWTSTAGSPLIT